MSKRMTDERLAEIECRRLRTPEEYPLPEGEGYPADSALTYELLQALKAERERVEELEAKLPTNEQLAVYDAAKRNHTGTEPFDERLVPNQWLLNERALSQEFSERIEELQAQVIRHEAAITSYRDDRDKLEATIERVRGLPEKWRIHQDPWIDENDKFRFPPDNDECADELEAALLDHSKTKEEIIK